MALINTRSPSTPLLLPLLRSNLRAPLLLPLARVFPQSLLSHHLFSPLPRRRRLASRMGNSKSVATAEPTAEKMVFEPILEDGVFRFDCSGKDRDAAFPSLSFADPKARDTPIPVHKAPEYVPTFECVYGQQKVEIKLPSGTSFYGTGEVSGQLERTGKRVFTWNTDAWGFGPETTSLYQSHPWVLALLPDGKALGVLADTTRRCEIDLREDSTIRLTAAAPYPIITFGPFGSPTEVLVSLSHAIGFSQNPNFNCHCVVLQIALFRIIMYRRFVCSAFYFPCSLY